MFKRLTSKSITLLTEPAAFKDRSGAGIADIERVVGLRRGNQVAWQDGEDRSGDNLTTRQIRVSRKNGCASF